MLTIRDLTLSVAFNKNLRAIKVGQVSQSVQGKRAGAGDLSKLTALFKGKLRSIFRFDTFVLTYLTLVRQSS